MISIFGRAKFISGISFSGRDARSRASDWHTWRCTDGSPPDALLKKRAAMKESMWANNDWERTSRGRDTDVTQHSHHVFGHACGPWTYSRLLVLVVFERLKEPSGSLHSLFDTDARAG